MPQIQQILDEIAGLDPVERELLEHSLLQNFLRDHAWPQPSAVEFPAAIVATPDVCGGAARLIRTRIPVWTLERMRQLGVSEANILQSFPTLRAADLVQAWAYVASHRDEIECVIRENEADEA